MSVDYQVIIIGAGISGIGFACQLQRKLGCKDFMIFESQDGVGGVWWSHRYPGVATDSPSPLYSFSFAGVPKTASPQATGEEMREYLYSVCASHRITDRIQLNTTVKHVIWDPVTKLWEVTLVYKQKEYRVRARVVISAVGKFGAPDMSILQTIPGIDSFQGRIMHTANWDSTVNLQEKDVTVIGAGCSAVQLVPQLLARDVQVRSVTQVVRSPHWVTPNPFSGHILRLWNLVIVKMLVYPLGAVAVRIVLFVLYEMFYLVFYRHPGSSGLAERWLRGRLLRQLESQAPQEALEVLRPTYSFGCKRVIVDGGWHATLKDPRLHLVSSHGRLRVEGKSVVIEAKFKERTIHTDLLVLATGYRPSLSLLSSIHVRGRDGTDLQELWKTRGGPQAYLGIAVDQFPNFFMLFGPNSSVSHGSVMAIIENTIDHILQLLRPILEGKFSTLEIERERCSEWTRKLQTASRNSVWVHGGCNNWYIDGGGWNSMIYPFSQTYHSYTFSRPDWNHWKVDEQLL